MHPVLWFEAKECALELFVDAGPFVTLLIGEDSWHHREEVSKEQKEIEEALLEFVPDSVRVAKVPSELDDLIRPDVFETMTFDEILKVGLKDYPGVRIIRDGKKSVDDHEPQHSQPTSRKNPAPHAKGSAPKSPPEKKR